MAAPKTQNVAADAAKAEGKSGLRSFRYYKGFCHISLQNGMSGIIGSSEEFPFATMLTLKGSGMEIWYREIGTWTDKDGTIKPKFALELGL